jgi:flagellar basal-body rod protein FlgG
MPNGNTGYTRSGALKRDSNGRLTNSDGYPLLPAITVPDNARQITISEGGIVSALIGADTTSTELGTLELAIFTNNSGLSAIGKNLFVESSASGTPQTGTPGYRRLRHPAAKLPGGIECQHRRGTGQHDHHPAGL